MSTAKVRAVELADHSIRAHDGLIFQGMEPLVPRKKQFLVFGGAADSPSSPVDEAPAVVERGPFGMHRLRVKYIQMGISTQWNVNLSIYNNVSLLAPLQTGKM